MNIRVLFFGATADITGKRVLEMNLTAKVTSGEIMKEVVARTPALAAQKLHLSLNQKFASGDELVHDGDELAIFTAVSGG